MIKVGITIGDPNGIGPEIALKAARMPRLQRLCQIILIGDISILERTAKKTRQYVPLAKWSKPSRNGVQIYQCTHASPVPIAWGKVTAQAGRAAINYVFQGGALAIDDQIDALVTCPISKEAVLAAGIKKFTGHTEYLAEMTGTKEFSLCLWHDAFRVAHVTCHVSLEKAVNLCQKARIIKVVHLLHEAIVAAGIRRPQIAIAGLNPHAGEAGVFGKEEIKRIAPAVKALQKQGLLVVGPVPPDVVFARMKAGVYDGVVSMIHDHGHVAAKTLFFSLGGRGRSTVGGVNVTLGMPIVRTSVDHGTSFDIAGKGVADTSSLVEAVELAVRLARRRKRTAKKPQLGRSFFEEFLPTNLAENVQRVWQQQASLAKGAWRSLTGDAKKMKRK